jgi:hypothetical protein
MLRSPPAACRTQPCNLAAAMPSASLRSYREADMTCSGVRSRHACDRAGRRTQRISPIAQ